MLAWSPSGVTNAKLCEYCIKEDVNLTEPVFLLSSSIAKIILKFQWKLIEKHLFKGVFSISMTVKCSNDWNSVKFSVKPSLGWRNIMQQENFICNLLFPSAGLIPIWSHLCKPLWILYQRGCKFDLTCVFVILIHCKNNFEISMKMHRETLV